MKTNNTNKNLTEKFPLVVYRSVFSDKGWDITWMNPVVKKMTGFSYENFKSDPKFWWSRLHPDDISYVKKEFDSLKKGEKEGVDVSYRWLHKDNTYHYYLDQAVMVKDGKNKLSEVLGTWINVSAYEMAEKALEENEEHYRNLVELCPLAIFIQVDGKFAFANSSAVRFFGGKNSEDILGKEIIHFIHPDHHEMMQKRLHILTNDRKEVPFSEFKIITLNGEVKTVEISATPFTYGGKKASQGVMLDITKRKQTEDFLKSQAEELEELNRLLLKRQIVSLAHEKTEHGCGTSFDIERSILRVGEKEVNVQKFSKQFNLLQVVFKDEVSLENDWQFSEISELMDVEAEFDWKKLYNIADAVRKNVAIETGIKDFFLLTTQSLKVNPSYLKKS